ncbi:MAG TPA: AI-2E family transporter [Acidobacteriaceae bacterium]|jgi:predicted PurR-regulated permease PerM|nr:AI-2E family transporter [Acidobacteriaceae bacterium]
MLPTIDTPGPITNRNLRGDIVFTFALGVGLYVAWLVRDVLAVMYMSGLFAVVLAPVVRGVMRLRIGKWHPGRVIAIFILTFGLLGLASLFMVLTLPPMVRDITDFLKELPNRSESLMSRVQDIPLVRKVDFPMIAIKLKQSASQYAGDILYSLTNWAAKLFDIITCIVLTVYFMIEGEHVYYWFLSMVPIERRERLDETLRRASIRMGGWLLGQLTLMLILGITSGIVFTFLHVRYSFVLATLLGVSNIIPVMGALVTGALALLAAAMDSWSKVLYVFIFGIIYAQVENAYITPRIMRTRVNLAGTAVIIALLVGAKLGGIAGAMVAVPTAVLVAVLLDEYFINIHAAVLTKSGELSPPSGK